MTPAASSLLTISGWASLVVIVLFMGAVQLIGLGIIGEYVRLIFLEAKGRPSYLVDDRRNRAATFRGPHRLASESLVEESRP